MPVTANEIISAVQTFPVSVQQEIIRALQKNLEERKSSKITEDEIEEILLAGGLISEIPKRLSDTEEEIYEPIEINGQPLSESILEDR